MVFLLGVFGNKDADDFTFGGSTSEAPASVWASDLQVL
jgi:hypothetical protein